MVRGKRVERVEVQRLDGSGMEETMSVSRCIFGSSLGRMDPS